MQIEENEHWKEIQGEDINGDFSLMILKDLSQMTLRSGDSDTYVNVNRRELTEIRDFIDTMLNL